MTGRAISVTFIDGRFSTIQRSCVYYNLGDKKLTFIYTNRNCRLLFNIYLIFFANEYNCCLMYQFKICTVYSTLVRGYINLIEL